MLECSLVEYFSALSNFNLHREFLYGLLIPSNGEFDQGMAIGFIHTQLGYIISGRDLPTLPSSFDDANLVGS